MSAFGICCIIAVSAIGIALIIYAIKFNWKE